MKTPVIVSIGKAVQDVFMQSSNAFEEHTHKGVVYEQLPVGQKLHLDDVIFSTGGNATNAATTFARQRLHSHYVWCLGNDMASEVILRTLDGEGVDTSAVFQDNHYRSSYSVILMLKGGERTILNYPGVMPRGDDSNLDLDAIASADWLYLSSLGDMELLEKLVSFAAEHNVKVMLNPASTELAHPEKLRSLLEDVEVLITNKEEAMEIVEGQSTEELVRHGLHYCPTVIVSDGPNGVVASDGKTLVTAGMYEDVKVVDRTGAGDAFGSGFLSQWSKGASLKDSIIFASANSTSVVTKIGAKEGILHHDALLHDMPIEEEEL
jgi:ribokinase